MKMTRFNRLLLVLLAAAAGFAGWQSWKLHQERAARADHLARSSSIAAYYLNTSAQTIADIGKHGKWDDPDTKRSLSMWLALTQQALTDANRTLQDYQGIRNSQDAVTMNDIFFWYLDWQNGYADALRKSAPLTAGDKAKLLQLNRIVSQVKDLYTGNIKDQAGIFAKFDALHGAWQAELG